MVVAMTGAVAAAAAAPAAAAAASVLASSVTPSRRRRACHHRSMLVATAVAAVAAATVVALSSAAAADGAAVPPPPPPTARSSTAAATTASIEPAVAAATAALAAASWDAPDMWSQPPPPPPSSLSPSSWTFSSLATGVADGQTPPGEEDVAGGAEEVVRLTGRLRSAASTASATAVKETEGSTANSGVPGSGSGTAGIPPPPANEGGKALPSANSAPSESPFASANPAASPLPPPSAGDAEEVMDPAVGVVEDELDVLYGSPPYEGGASTPPFSDAIHGDGRPSLPLRRSASPVASSAGPGVTVSNFGEDYDPPAGLMHPPLSRATDAAGGVVAGSTAPTKGAREMAAPAGVMHPPGGSPRLPVAASAAAAVSNTAAVTAAAVPENVAAPFTAAVGRPPAGEASPYFPYGRAWPPAGAHPSFERDHAAALFEASAMLRRLAESEVATTTMPPSSRASGVAPPPAPAGPSMWAADGPAAVSPPPLPPSPPPRPPLPPPSRSKPLSSRSLPQSLAPSPSLSSPLPSPSRSSPMLPSRPTPSQASLPQPPPLPPSPPPPPPLSPSPPPPRQRSSAAASLTRLPSPSVPSASFRSPPPPPLGRVAAPAHRTVRFSNGVLRDDEDAAADVATARCKAANEQLMLAHNMRDFHDEGGSRAFKASLWALRQLLRDTDGQEKAGVGFLSSVGTNGVRSPTRRREPGMVVDVGANRGQSIETWASLFPGGNIILVEGNPSTAKVLEEVVAKRQQAAASGQARGVAAVKVVRALVGNTTRVVTFRSSINGRSSELSGVFADGSPKVRLTEFEYLVRHAAFFCGFPVVAVFSWSHAHGGCACVGPWKRCLAVAPRGIQHLTRPHLLLPALLPLVL